MTYKLTNFLGISNRRPAFDLHIKTNTTQGDYLRDAINVEIDNTGRLLRRKKATFVTPSGPTTCELYSALAAIDGVGSYKLHASFHPTNFLPTYRTGSEGKLTYEFTKICGWV